MSLYLFSGGGDIHGNSTSSTEIWDGKTWKSHVELPRPLESHCIVKINSSHVFVGGGDFIAKNNYSLISLMAFIYDGNEFTPVANLSMPRINPACGLHEDHYVFVTGGNFDDEYDSYETSEYFSLKTMTWNEGPSFDSEADGGQILSTNNRTILIGNNYIYELIKVGEESWEWEKLGMFDERESFDAFLIAGDCKNWTNGDINDKDDDDEHYFN